MKPVKVLAEPGDLIVWDSRTIHWGGEPEPGKSNVIRTGIYAAYAPARMATPEALMEKKKVFNQNGGTTQWPHDSIKMRNLQAKFPDGTPDQDIGLSFWRKQSRQSSCCGWQACMRIK